MNRTKFIGTNLYYSQEFVDEMENKYNQEIERLNNIIKEKKIPEKIYYNGDDYEKKIIIDTIDEIIDYLKSKGD